MTSRAADNKGTSQRAARSRSALIRAAIDLFARHGYAATSTQQIAEQAGINKAMISYYFGGKRGLYTAVLLDLLNDAVSITEVIGSKESDPVTRLRAFISGLCNLMDRRPEFPLIISKEQMSGSADMAPEVVSSLLRLSRFTRSVFEDGMESGLFRQISINEAHLSLIGGLIYFYLTAPARKHYVSEGHVAESDLPHAQVHCKQFQQIFISGLLSGGH